MKIECSLNVLEKEWWFDLGLSIQKTKHHADYNFVTTLSFVFFSVYIRTGWKHPNPCKEGHIVKDRPDLGIDEKGRNKHTECINCGQIFTPKFYVPRPLDNNSDI